MNKSTLILIAFAVAGVALGLAAHGMKDWQTAANASA
jgi:hypothetical protein